MKRSRRAWIFTATLLGLLLGQQARAQFTYTPPGMNSYNHQPTMSFTYLNLGRGGSTAVNYFGLVRPELQTMQSLNQLHLQQRQLSAGMGVYSGNSGLSLGGRHVYFRNYSHYFPGPNGQVTGGGSSASTNNGAGQAPTARFGLGSR